MTVKFEYTGKLSDGRYFDTDSTKKVTIELDDNDLSVNEMLEEFMNFMKAIGYNFDLGDHLEIVNDFKDWKEKSAELDDDKLDVVKNQLNIDLNKMVGTSHPEYGAVPPQPIVDEGGGVIGVAHPPVESKDPY